MPRTHVGQLHRLFTSQPLCHRNLLTSVARFSTSSSSSSSSSSKGPLSQPPWAEQPSPPRLPKEEQEIFEKLQRSSTGAFQTSATATAETTAKAGNGGKDAVEELLEHPHLQRGEKPLFEGDVNPVTGEVGGPKTDPLKYGDYAFNGRVTDF